RRRDHCGTEKHDRFRRTTRHQGNDSSGLTPEISNRRVSPGTRFHRYDRASEKAAGGNQSIARLLFRDAVTGERGPVPRPFSSYKEALAWLYRLQRFGIKLGLENIQRLLNDLQILPGLKGVPWKIIHVAGTNGKGSVCAMIDS